MDPSMAHVPSGTVEALTMNVRLSAVIKLSLPRGMKLE
jgi:hypothetical protein